MISTLTALGNDVPTRAGAGSGNEVPAPERGGHQGQKGHQALAGPRHRVSPTVLNLLQTARRGLAEADAEGDPGTRYICAHLAALRAAAAIVAARGEPGTGGRRRRPRSVWELLPQVEPALAEWAAFFAAARGERGQACRRRGGPAAGGDRARGRGSAQGRGDVPVGCRAGARGGQPADSTPQVGQLSRPPGERLAPRRVGGGSQKDSMAVLRASASSTPQPMSSSVRSAGDLS